MLINTCLVALVGLLFGVCKGAAISVTEVATIAHIDSFIQFRSLNLVDLNGVFYSFFGFGMHKATPTSTQYALINSPVLSFPSPVVSIPSMMGIPEIGKIFFVNQIGEIFIIDPIDLNSPIKANFSLPYYGTYKDISVYQIRRITPMSNYFLIFHLNGKTIWKVDFSNLQAAIRIVPYSSKSPGYEMASTSGQFFAAVSSDSANLDIFNSGTGTYIKTSTVFSSAFGLSFKGIEYFPRAQTPNFFLVTRSEKKAFLMDLAADVVVKSYQVSSTYPVLTQQIPHTNYILVGGVDPYIDFLDMYGSDSNTKTWTFSSPVYYMAAVFYRSPGNPTRMVATFHPKFYTGVYDFGTNLCHFSCLTCSASIDPDYCTACATGFILSGSMCIPQAPPGQVTTSGGSLGSTCNPSEYMNADRLCKPCPTNCADCTSPFGMCTSCNGGYVLSVSKVCTPTCPSGEYPLPSSPNTCNNCHMSCSTCSGPLETNCLTCDAAKTHLVLGASKCVSDCTTSPNFTYDLPSDTCKESPPNCLNSVTFSLTQSCTKCQSTYWYTFGFCDFQCYDGLYPNTATRSCDRCEEIAPDTIFYQGQCILNSQCPPPLIYANMTCQDPAALPPPPSPGLNTTGGTTNPTVADTVKGTPVDTGKGSSGGTLLLSIILIVVSLIIGAIALYLFCRARRREKVEQQNMQQMQQAMGVQGQPPVGLFAGSQMQPGRRMRNSIAQHQDLPLEDPADDWDVPPQPPQPPQIQVINLEKAKPFAPKPYQVPMISNTAPSKKTSIAQANKPPSNEWEIAHTPPSEERMNISRIKFSNNAQVGKDQQSPSCPFSQSMSPQEGSQQVFIPKKLMKKTTIGNTQQQ